MEHSFLNPSVPYTDRVIGTICDGKMIRIKGMVPEEFQRFMINFKCELSNDIAFSIVARKEDGCIARNSMHAGTWGTEETTGPKHWIVAEQMFEILILCTATVFKIAVNGHHYCDFLERISSHQITHLEIEGDIMVMQISYENARSPLGRGATLLSHSSTSTPSHHNSNIAIAVPQTVVTEPTITLPAKIDTQAMLLMAQQQGCWGRLSLKWKTCIIVNISVWVVIIIIVIYGFFTFGSLDDDDEEELRFCRRHYQV